MPAAWTPSTKRLVVAAMLVAILYLVFLGRRILTPFVLGALLALALHPLIDLISRRLRFPRGLAVAVAYLLLVGTLVTIPILVVPALVKSASAIDMTAIAQDITNWALNTLESLRDVQFFGGATDLSSVIDPIIDAIKTGNGIDFGAIFSGAWGFTGRIFGGIIGFITTSILALVLSVYLAAGSHGARQSFYSLVPEQYQIEIRILGARMGRVWTDYLRGQLTVALVLSVLTTITLLILGMPGALILGVIGGFLNIVPTFGPIIAGLIASVVALVQGSHRLSVSNFVFALIVAGAYTVLQQLESNVITPRILGGAVQVSPLAILIGILIGFSTAGVLGAIIAVPVVASGRELFRYLMAKLADRDPYPEGLPPPRRRLGDRIDKLFGKDGPPPEVNDSSESQPEEEPALPPAPAS
jgi:predicted PurR-regulated permease PerM